MRIEFVRSGGFAGLFLTANIDLQTLSPEESAAFEKEINGRSSLICAKD